MKKITLLFVVSFILFSCEKDDFVPTEELPDWLVSKIQSDEQFIEESPHSYPSWGAWVRFEWNSGFYYEYWNLLSSSLTYPISHSGDTLDYLTEKTDSDYMLERCCQKYVWKGPNVEDWMYDH
jgi:hypothetical protein